MRFTHNCIIQYCLPIFRAGVLSQCQQWSNVLLLTYMLNPFYLLIHKLYIISWDRWVLGLGDSSDSSDSVTIVIISVTITTVIAKNYYRDSGHVVTGMCIWHCLVSTYPQPCEKNMWRCMAKIYIYILMRSILTKSWRVMYGST